MQRRVDVGSHELTHEFERLRYYFPALNTYVIDPDENLVNELIQRSLIAIESGQSEPQDPLYYIEDDWWSSKKRKRWWKIWTW